MLCSKNAVETLPKGPKTGIAKTSELVEELKDGVHNAMLYPVQHVHMDVCPLKQPVLLYLQNDPGLCIGELAHIAQIVVFLHKSTFQLCKTLLLCI